MCFACLDRSKCGQFFFQPLIVCLQLQLMRSHVCGHTLLIYGHPSMLISGCLVLLHTGLSSTTPTPCHGGTDRCNKPVTQASLAWLDVQAVVCQRRQQDRMMGVSNAAAAPGLGSACFLKPPRAPQRTLPVSAWSGPCDLGVAACPQPTGSLHSIQAGPYPTLLQQRIHFEQIYGQSDQQLTDIAAAWCKPDVPRVAAMQNLPSAAEMLQPISCRSNWALPEPFAVPAAHQQTHARHTAHTVPSRPKSNHNRLQASLHQDQKTKTMLKFQYEDQCSLPSAAPPARHPCPSDILQSREHPMGASIHQPIGSTAELLTRLNSGQTTDTLSDSGSTASKAASLEGCEQQIEGFEVTSPHFVQACKTFDQISPQASPITHVQTAVHHQQEFVPASAQQTMCTCAPQPGLRWVLYA